VDQEKSAPMALVLRPGGRTSHLRLTPAVPEEELLSVVPADCEVPKTVLEYFSASEPKTSD